MLGRKVNKECLSWTVRFGRAQYMHPLPKRKAENAPVNKGFCRFTLFKSTVRAGVAHKMEKRIPRIGCRSREPPSQLAGRTGQRNRHALNLSREAISAPGSGRASQNGARSTAARP